MQCQATGIIQNSIYGRNYIEFETRGKNESGRREQPCQGFDSDKINYLTSTKIFVSVFTNRDVGTGYFVVSSYILDEIGNKIISNEIEIKNHKEDRRKLSIKRSKFSSGKNNKTYYLKLNVVSNTQGLIFLKEFRVKLFSPSYASQHRSKKIVNGIVNPYFCQEGALLPSQIGSATTSPLDGQIRQRASVSQAAESQSKQRSHKPIDTSQVSDLAAGLPFTRSLSGHVQLPPLSKGSRVMGFGGNL